MKKYILEITVFICGAIGMVLELVAARVLSPYVGSSNLIWTTIIGVMLTSMSIGYWLGGKLADKRPERKVMSMLILIGAMFNSLIPLLETLLIKPFSEVTQNLVIIAFITAAIVFGLPSFILASISPYAVKLKDKEHENIGKTSGKLSSISTLGSIAGTFLAGFILIPSFGVRNIILGTTIVLIILSIFLYDNINKKYIISMIGITALAIILVFLGKVIFERKNGAIIRDVDSQYSRIWIKAQSRDNIEYKTMLVDASLESYINKETNEMGAKYLKYYDLFEYFKKDSKSSLIIGGAAYTYPMHYLNKYSDKTIDVSEIDETMTKLAQEEFGLDTSNKRLNIHHQDGRTYLNYSKNKYDCIFIDAFKGKSVPFELTTKEAMQNAKRMLKDDGIIITNTISAIEGKNSDFIKYEYSTYKEVFEDVKLFQVTNEDKEETQNIILVGIKGKPQVDASKFQEYEELLNTEIKDFQSDKQVVTDNYAPIGN